MMELTNRQSAECFGQNLAKWKRWSREFLPPDPSAGMQCGVSRKYNIKELFTIFLGGYLVGTLKYSIPEARMIINDLMPWFKEMKFLPVVPFENWKNVLSSITFWTLNIMRGGNSGFCYEAKGLMDRQLINAEKNRYQEIYEYKLINFNEEQRGVDMLNVRKLAITTLIEVFCGSIRNLTL